MKERLSYIDQLRGLAILLVVIGHILQFNNIQGGANNRIFKIIYSFNMPLFFFVSGYIGYKTVKVYDLKSFGKHILKKFISLCIPLFSWSFLVNGLFFKQHWKILPLDTIISTVLNPGLWFLKVLFEIFVFYGLFAWLSSYFNKKKKCWMDILLFFLILVLTSGFCLFENGKIFSSLLLYTLFFYMAVFVSKYLFLEKGMKNNWIFAFSVLAFFILCGHWGMNDGLMIDDLLKIIISVFSFIVFFNIVIKLKWNSFISKQVILLGRYSLAIYIMQFYFTTFMIKRDVLVFDNLNYWLILLICFIVSIIICYISIGIAKIIELNYILNFLLLGKRKKVYEGVK